jgi:fatty-acyl-CoA synthase
MGEVIAEIIRLVRAEIGIVLSEVHLIKRGTLPKTSSGKVRRREAKRRLDEGELELLAEGDLSHGPMSDAPPPPSATADTVPPPSGVHVHSSPRPPIAAAREA